MGNFRKKVSGILQTDFHGEKLARIYLGKISCTEKKHIAHEVYNAEKKIFTPLYVREKNSNSRGFGKNSYPNLITQTPPPPQKLHGQPHRGWGRSGFGTLVDVIRQQNGWRAFIMWWFLRLKLADKRNKWK